MKRLHAVMVLVTAGIFAVSGCATIPASMTMTCAAVGKSQLTSHGSRIDLGSFSVQLPDDTQIWCIGGSGTGWLGLNTHALMGQYIEKPERFMALNTVALAAMELDHGSNQFETSIVLHDFVEDWIDRGFGAEGEGTNIKVMRSRVQRFTVKRLNVTPDPRPQALCVRYEYQMEERDNPQAPNKTLILDEYGLVCQHPSIPSSIVVMTLSERYPEGSQIDPGLLPKLKRDTAQTFFGSLQF